MKFQDVEKPEKIPGMKVWVNENNGYTVAMVHYSCDPNKDPAREGKEWYDTIKKGMPKAKWLKEYEIDSTTKSGALVYGPEYCDFSPAHHFIKSFPIPEPFELLISLDFGQRHPTAAHVGAWTRDGTLYIIDEYFKPNIPSKTSREMFKKFAHHMGINKGTAEKMSIDDRRNKVIESFSTRVIDPSTLAKNRTKKDGFGGEEEYSIIEDFWDNGWDFSPASNAVAAGITRMREYFQIVDGKAKLYIFADKCPNLCRELQTYRYKQLTEKQLKLNAESEQVVKLKDDSCDSARYLVMTRPATPTIAEKPKTAIQLDIEKKLRPQIIEMDY